MALAGIFIALDEDEVLVEGRNNTRIIRRQLRDMQNPFEIRNSEFIKNFRLSKEACLFLLDQMQPHLQVGLRRTKIPNHLRFLSVLNFFAMGSYQRSIANNYLSSISQPVVSRSIREFANVLIGQLMQHWIKFPNNVESREICKQRFLHMHRMHNIIGTIDGTHVAIVKPRENEQAFINRKGYHSLNVQIICDANYRILSILSRYPGSSHDSFVWRSSRIRSIMQANYENGDHNSRLLGDSGYPCLPWLMVPVRNPVTHQEEHFNTVFKTARSCVERCIGLLKGRFRCLLKDRTLHYFPSNAARIVMACAILHNVCIQFNVGEPEPMLDDIDMEPEQLQNPGAAGMQYRQLGQQARAEYINEYF